MTDFASRFGQLDLGPRHPNNPADKSLALYDANTLARRYYFADEAGNAWAVDTKTGERAFRIDAKGRTFLPDGREIATPKLTPRKSDSTEDRLYGKAKPRTLLGDTLLSDPKKPASIERDDGQARLARALYGKGSIDA